jgi:HTH-type transcriptional regulator/antitoxin HigA
MKATLIVIQNDADHAEAKVLVEKLMGSSAAEDRARAIAQARLIEAHERNRWPRRTAALPEILRYLMEQHELTRADLVPILGTPSRVSEVLSGKRDLSMTMVRKLRERFHISADLLISPTTAAGRSRKRLAA